MGSKKIDLAHLFMVDNTRRVVKKQRKTKKGRRMKYNNLLVLLSVGAITSSILATNPSDSSRIEDTNKTTLSIHPLFASQSPEMVSCFRNDRNQTRENGRGGAFQAVLFGSVTTDSDDLARYFFPNAQESLVAAEDSDVPSPGFTVKKDLLAQDFNVITVNHNFQSTITIAPKQSVIGLGLHYRQSFWKNHDRGRGFWLSVSSPIMHVKNDMNFHEDVTNDGGGAAPAASTPGVIPVANMTEAFQQAAWNFGKIASCASMKKTGLGDIEFKVGYEWLQHEPAHTETYFGLIIPTGNKNKGIYVFEPIVGRGKNWGVMFGSALGLEIWNNEAGDKTLRYELVSHTEFLFDRKEVRSFDLKNRPWSRYLPVYLNVTQATLADTEVSQYLSTPGINVFTQDVKVTPGIATDINTAFVFSVRKFQAEVGYNFLAKRDEDVKLACCWQPGPALVHFEGDGFTNPIRTIDGNQYYEQTVTNEPNSATELIPVTLANYANSLIQESDLNLNSASTPALLSNTLYGTLGFQCEDREYPLFGNVGVSYTFSKNNGAVPRRWIMWAKMGVSF